MSTNYKKELNKEWAKPKKKNLKRDKNGTIIDARQPRCYNKIDELHELINLSK